ncbi:MAG: VWA domain-containing protein [Chloroflexi bacterium]|nr:VWA domain-containing protein [Chloroflexota bacterium]
MNFLTPLAFVLAALLPIIVALYFLKLRRTEQRVSSTYLWRTLVRDTAANAPWQKLKPNLLLLLQLLFLLVLIVALARPFLWSEQVASSHLILVLDTSASMGATDVSPNRLSSAVTQARRLIENVAAGARVTVIDAGASVRVPVSGTTDKGAAFGALDALRAGLSDTDLASALTLAGAMAANEPDAQVVILSDGHVTLPENFALTARTQFIPIGSGRNNQALGAFTLSSDASGKTLTAFVQVVNNGEQASTRRLVLRDETGALVAARDVNLAPSQAQSFTFPDLKTDTAYRAQLEGADQLALDDSAWAVAPSREKIQVRVVTTGNRFLETALALLPNVELTTIKPDELSLSPTLPLSITQSLASSLTIYDSVIPTATLSSGNLFFIAPPRATEFFSVTGQIQAPQPIVVSADDPVARYVDLRDVAIQDATRLELPKWGRAVWVDRTSGAPLLVVGEENGDASSRTPRNPSNMRDDASGRRIGILAFDVRHSDLPLRVAFPLLLANVLDALAPGGASGIATTVEPGHALALTVKPETTSVIVRAPDGTNHTLTPKQGRVAFDRTAQLGVYEIFVQDRAGKTEPSARFAVNALNADESDITPRANLTIRGATGATNVELPRARNEWWMPLAWIALGLLIVEWLVAYRGQVTQVIRKASNVRRQT